MSIHTAAPGVTTKTRASRGPPQSTDSAAAGLALIFGLGLFLHQPPSTADQQIVQTIELLNESEDVGMETTEDMNTADILLAWQDAPYANLEDELTLGNL